MIRPRLRLMGLRWRLVLRGNNDTAAWLKHYREPLKRALAQVYRDDLLALHWLRMLLLRYW